MEWFVHYTQSVETSRSLFIFLFMAAWIRHDYSNEIIFLKPATEKPVTLLTNPLYMNTEIPSFILNIFISMNLIELYPFLKKSLLPENEYSHFPHVYFVIVDLLFYV